MSHPQSRTQDSDINNLAGDVATMSLKRHEVGETSNGLISLHLSSASDGLALSRYPWPPSDSLTSSQFSPSLDGSTSLLYSPSSSDGLSSSQDSSSSSDWFTSPHGHHRRVRLIRHIQVILRRMCRHLATLPRRIAPSHTQSLSDHNLHQEELFVALSYYFEGRVSPTTLIS